MMFLANLKPHINSPQPTSHDLSFASLFDKPAPVSKPARHMDDNSSPRF